MATKKQTKAKPAAKKTGGTIKEFVTPLVKDSKLTIEQIVDKVKAKFPDSAFNRTHVYWYRQHTEGAVTVKRAKSDVTKAIKKIAKKAAKKTAKKTAKKSAKAPEKKSPTLESAIKSLKDEVTGTQAETAAA